MLKSAIAATISIVSILFISSIADARSLSQKSKHHTVNQSKSLLIAKNIKTSNNIVIPESDLKGIHQAITKRYKLLNEQRIPSKEVWSGACSFIVVKSLKIVYFVASEEAGTATVETEEEQQTYSIKGVQKKPRVLAFQKYKEKSSLYKKNNIISVLKKDGKWQ
jgi:hypothetical protein